MKKILNCLFAAAILAGCSSGADESPMVRKTCSSNIEGMELQVAAEAKDEKSKVENVTMEINAKYEDMGFTKEDLSLLDMEKDFLDMMENVVLSSLDLDKEADGVEIVKNELVDDGYHLLIKVDIEKMPTASKSLKKVTLTDFTEMMEEDMAMKCD